ncbi:hypothetical protein SRABI133_01575 [Peribacillus simplex]|uniref:Uncharacterized protein n=1 Tax=Peribacillus simplex TaxID=1478 RepID=A0A9W4PCZ3_9BACI|nr:hypothetical protein SRABI133_01575 [Peribacillus simplex]
MGGIHMPIVDAILLGAVLYFGGLFTRTVMKDES